MSDVCHSNSNARYDCTDYSAVQIGMIGIKNFYRLRGCDARLLLGKIELIEEFVTHLAYEHIESGFQFNRKSEYKIGFSVQFDIGIGH